MPLPTAFPVHDWERCFSSNTVDKGMDYAASDRVVELRALDDGGYRWAGRVKGSGSNGYASEALLVPSAGRGKPRLISQYSCPVGMA